MNHFIPKYGICWPPVLLISSSAYFLPVQGASVKIKLQRSVTLVFPVQYFNI